ncbi:MAG TPA: VWA domain-containing protein, partial [Pirellulales bacterium]|nr:VWA domain-containing protein [Pirellulales bacterium]
EDATLRESLMLQLKDLGLTELTRENLAKAILLKNQGELLSEIEKQFKLRVYFLSETAQATGGSSADVRRAVRELDPRGGQTRLGSGVHKILDDLRGAPPAAILLFTDGINTEGETLAEAANIAKRKGVPLFTIGLGSEQAVRDLELTDLLVDEVAFVNDILNFEFKITSSGYQGRALEVVLRDKLGGAVLARKTVLAGPDGQPSKVRLPYRPTQVGDFEYVVEVVPLADEANPDNNQLRRQVSVRKERVRVLLVQAYPSYEFRFLKHLLERDKNSIEVNVVLQDADVEFAEIDKSALRAFPPRREDLFAYDVVIFGDVNLAYLSASAQQNLVDFVKEKGGGVVFIAGPKYDPATYRDSPLAALFPVELDSVKPIAAEIKQGYHAVPTELGLASPQLQLGDSLAETAQIWHKLPELYGLCEAPHVKPGAHVLAEHPALTGDEGQKLPIIVMQYVGAGKVIFHATDDTYRWRYRVGDVFFARYWMQTIRYLSRSKLLGKDRSAELVVDRREYQRGESVQLRVRFVDERLAPPQDDGVSVMVEQQGRQTRRLTLHRDANNRGVFEGLLSQPSEGTFHAWLATPTLPGAAPSADFMVVAPPGESERLQMDAGALRQAAAATKGRFYTIANANALSHELPEGRPIPIESLPPQPLWNRWQVLALFLMLIVAEWVGRKSQGMV